MVATVKSDGTAPPRARKRASQISRDIGDLIVSMGWPVGAVVGSEADLCDRFDVSRAVLREAIRLVEHHTAASMRRGPGGGLVVREPDTSAVIKAVIVYLESVDVSIADIFEARMILEPLAARWAAEKSGASAVEELDEMLAHEHRVKAAELASPSQELVHRSIASLAGNVVLELFVEVVTDLTALYARTAPHLSREELRAASDGVTHAHEVMIQAILDGDGDVAEQRTAKHLVAMAEWLSSKYGGASTAKQARIRARRRSEPPRVPGAKMAEHVADRLRDDLLRSDLGPGEFLGSEADLLGRYGVSRAVLREAIRLLEHHGVAATRRGPGGGLMVANPDPGASVEAMALLLDFRGVSLDQVAEVRDALELACVRRLATRIDEPETRAGVSDLVERLDAVRRSGHPGTASLEFHAELAELTGNPLLSLFVQILGRIGSRHFDPPEGGAADEIDTSSLRAHGAIAAAILKGDTGLAQARMRRHMKAVDEWWCDRPSAGGLRHGS